jgi:hypothetical protein
MVDLTVFLPICKFPFRVMKTVTDSTSPNVLPIILNDLNKKLLDTINSIEVLKETSFNSNSLAPNINATGGSTSSYTLNNITYRVHSFTSSGNFIVSSGRGDVEYIIVAGGGGGGETHGGGGGAGGVVQSTATVFPNQTYSVVVGGGGNPAANGSNSSIFNNTAVGGGYGGNHSPQQSAGSGGSGGNRWGSSNPSIGRSVNGFGYPGSGGAPTWGGGGGGGAYGSANQNVGGNGLPISSFTGSYFDYAAVGGSGETPATFPWPRNPQAVNSPTKYGNGGNPSPTAVSNDPQYTAGPGAVLIKYAV